MVPSPATLPRSFGLLFPPYAGAFVVLMLTDIPQDTRPLALSLEAAQGAVEVLIFSYSYLWQSSSLPPPQEFPRSQATPGLYTSILYAVNSVKAFCRGAAILSSRNGSEMSEAQPQLHMLWQIGLPPEILSAGGAPLSSLLLDVPPQVPPETG